jgi:hypothetical protein
MTLAPSALGPYFNYSMRRKDVLKPVQPEGFFLDRFGPSEPLEVAFLTTDEMDSPPLAEQHLSLTYEPRFRTVFRDPHTCASKLRWNTGCTCNVAQPTRAWPAFGRVGGATEIILTGDPLLNGASFELPEPDPPDPYRQDSVQPGVVPVSRGMAAGIIEEVGRLMQGAGFDALAEPQEGQPRDRWGAVKIGPTGFVWAWNDLADKDLCYSISCAYFEHPCSCCTRLKLWGSLWRDLDSCGNRSGCYRRWAVPFTFTCSGHGSIHLLRAWHHLGLWTDVMDAATWMAKEFKMSGSCHLLKGHERPHVVLPDFLCGMARPCENSSPS